MSDWKSFCLGDVCIINAESYSKNDNWTFVNYLDTGNITANKIEDVQYINILEEKFPSRARRKVKTDSIIYSTVRPNQRHYGIIKSQPKNFLVSTGFAVIDVNPEIVDANFLYYRLTQDEVVQYLQSVAEQSTTAYPSIRPADVENLKFSFPSMDIQKKIAAVLSALDDKIELNNAINRNLEEQAQAIYKKICLRAKLAPLSELIEIVESGSRPKGGATTSGIPSIGAEKIDGFGRYDYSNEKFIDTDYFKRLKRGIVFSGDVMLYKDGAYTGKSSMALDGFPHEICAVNEHVFLLRTKDSRAQFFLYFTLRNEDVYKKIHVLACGKAAQPGLNQKELMCVTSFLPEEEVIQKFESVVSPMMHSIALNALENKKLGDVRDSLLPRLMSGEIDVSEVEI